MLANGCDRFCSYCIIPMARGPVRSRSLKDISDEAARFAEFGYKEIVITGINISRYGADLGLSLPDAVNAVAASSDARIRLGSLEPDLLSDEMLHIFSSMPNLCPHFHLALQSGCDSTLRRMNRRYTAKQFFDKVSLIRSVFKNPSITTDIIVGFPGETDNEFEETCDFVKSLNLLRAHIFEFSPRKNTPAFSMDNQIAPSIKKARFDILTETCRISSENFAKSQVGTDAKVLLEATGTGYTENYLNVTLPASQKRAGDIIDVYINEADGASCKAVEIK